MPTLAAPHKCPVRQATHEPSRREHLPRNLALMLIARKPHSAREAPVLALRVTNDAVSVEDRLKFQVLPGLVSHDMRIAMNVGT